MGLCKLPSGFACPATATAIIPASMVYSFKLDRGPGTVPATYVQPLSSASDTTKLVLPFSPSLSQTNACPSPSHLASLALLSLLRSVDWPLAISSTQISDVLECDSKE